MCTWPGWRWVSATWSRLDSGSHTALARRRGQGRPAAGRGPSRTGPAHRPDGAAEGRREGRPTALDASRAAGIAELEIRAHNQLAFSLSRAKQFDEAGQHLDAALATPPHRQHRPRGPAVVNPGLDGALPGVRSGLDGPIQGDRAAHRRLRVLPRASTWRAPSPSPCATSPKRRSRAAASQTGSPTPWSAFSGRGAATQPRRRPSQSSSSARRP